MRRTASHARRPTLLIKTLDRKGSPRGDGDPRRSTARQQAPGLPKPAVRPWRRPQHRRRLLSADGAGTWRCHAGARAGAWRRHIGPRAGQRRCHAGARAGTQRCRAGAWAGAVARQVKLRGAWPKERRRPTLLPHRPASGPGQPRRQHKRRKGCPKWPARDATAQERWRTQAEARQGARCSKQRGGRHGLGLLPGHLGLLTQYLRLLPMLRALSVLQSNPLRRLVFIPLTCCLHSGRLSTAGAAAAAIRRSGSRWCFLSARLSTRACPGASSSSLFELGATCRV